MKTRTAALSLAVLATGALGGAVAYASTAPQPSAEQTVSAPAPEPDQPATQAANRPHVKVKVRFRECRRGATLEHGTCVRHVVHTVVEPAPSVVTIVPSSTTRAAGSDHPRHRDHRPGVGHGENDHAATSAHEPGDDDGHESDDHSEQPEPPEHDDD